jgi:hypothetical protein
MYEYNKPWYAFGIVKKIYYSKNCIWLVEFTDKSTERLLDCSLSNFKYTSDRSAYIRAKEESYRIKDTLDYVVFENQ